MNSYNITILMIYNTETEGLSLCKRRVIKSAHTFGTAAKMVNKKINKAGLVDIIGNSGL